MFGKVLLTSTGHFVQLKWNKSPRCVDIGNVKCILIFCHSVFFPHSGILQHMRSYKKALDFTYSHSEEIAVLTEAAGRRYGYWNNLTCDNNHNKNGCSCSLCELCVSVCSVGGRCVTWAGAPWVCWALSTPVNVSPHSEQVRLLREIFLKIYCSKK